MSVLLHLRLHPAHYFTVITAKEEFEKPFREIMTPNYLQQESVVFQMPKRTVRNVESV